MLFSCSTAEIRGYWCWPNFLLSSTSCIPGSSFTGSRLFQDPGSSSPAARTRPADHVTAPRLGPVTGSGGRPKETRRVWAWAVVLHSGINCSESNVKEMCRCVCTENPTRLPATWHWANLDTLRLSPGYTSTLLEMECEYFSVSR